MRVVRNVARRREVDDVRHACNVEAARGDVGGNQGANLSLSERRHDAEARGLVVASVQGLDPDRQALEAPHQAVDFGASIAENEEQLVGRGVHQQALEHVRAVFFTEEDDALGNAVDGRHPLGGGEFHRVAGVLARER